MEDITRGMGEMMGMAQGDPTKMLTEEHNKVKDLFGEFERATDMEKKGKVFADIVKNLNAHTGVEEAIFYPVAQQIMGDQQMVQQSLKEHMEMKEHMTHIAMLMGNEEVLRMMPQAGQGRTMTEPGMTQPRMTEQRPMDTEIRTDRPDAGGRMSTMGHPVSSEGAMSGYEARHDTEMPSSKPGMSSEPMMPDRFAMGTGSIGQQMGISGTYMDHFQMLKDGLLKHVQMEEGQMFQMVKQAIPEDQLGKIARMMFEKKHQLM